MKKIIQRFERLVLAALDTETQEPVLVSDLNVSQRGYGCNCVCAGCGKKLSAKLGKVKKHHFAHAASNDSTEVSLNCFETSLRLMAKILLSRESKIDLMMNSRNAPVIHSKYLGQITGINKSCGILGFNILETQTEQQIGNITSNIQSICQLKDIKLPVNFDIKVSSNISLEKLDMIREADVTTIEIDISNLRNYSEITEAMVLSELTNTDNHFCLHLSSEIESYCQNLLKEKLIVSTDNLHALIDLWINKTNSYYRHKTFKLPHFILSPRTEAKNKYGQTVYLNGIHSHKPNLDLPISYDAINSIGDSKLLLSGMFAGKEFLLPILLTHDFNQKVQLSSDKSYLQISLEELQNALDKKYFIPGLSWGNNVKVNAWKANRGLEINKLILKSESKERSYAARLVDKAKLINPSTEIPHQTIVRSSRIKTELLKFGLSEIQLQYLLCPELKDRYTFRATPEQWQCAFLYVLLKRGYHEQIDFSWMEKQIENEAFILIDPLFKKLSYKSKIVKEIGFELPFTSSFSLFGIYSRYLREEKSAILNAVFSKNEEQARKKNNSYIPDGSKYVERDIKKLELNYQRIKNEYKTEKTDPFDEILNDMFS